GTAGWRSGASRRLVWLGQLIFGTSEVSSGTRGRQRCGGNSRRRPVLGDIIDGVGLEADRDGVLGVQDLFLNPNAVDPDPVGAAQVPNHPTAVIEGQLTMQAGHPGKAQANSTGLPATDGHRRLKQGEPRTDADWNQFTIACLAHGGRRSLP